MAKVNYSYEKRQLELKKQKKQEEKRQRKQGKKEDEIDETQADTAHGEKES